VEKDYTQEFIDWQPLEDAALFANFAGVQHDKDALCEWACANGRLVRAEKLSDGSSLHVKPHNSTVSTGGVKFSNITHGESYVQTAESASFWLREHRHLSFAVMVWEQIFTGNKNALSKIVTWFIDNKGVQINTFNPELLHVIDLDKLNDPSYRQEQKIGFEVLFNHQHIRSWASERFRYPDVIKPARLFVQVKINEKLHEHPLQTALALDDRGTLHKIIQPSSLLSAMWHQLYLALSGEINLRRCSICGKWEDMKGHRVNWGKHKKCASHERVKRFRAEEVRNDLLRQ
jgi:hypothetical protein